ncbi:MAG: hypothetical protein HY791_03050 [Deltaproteobacteria bacterium]|nr:hypothetical protein [Deltaproteobacteria bacterium]
MKARGVIVGLESAPSIRQQAKDEHEFYKTPSSAVRPLIDANVLPEGRWLEPCAGDGAIIRSVPGPEWWAADIRPEAGRPLEALVGPRVRCPLDFRTDKFVALLRETRPDVVITNPPNSLAIVLAQIVRRELPDMWLALLQPCTMLATVERWKWLRKDSPNVNWLVERPDFLGTGGIQEYCWFVWPPLRRRPAPKFFFLPPAGWVEPPEQPSLFMEARHG